MGRGAAAVRGVLAARIMLGFGRDVKVVSPPEVRADHAAVAAAVVAQYTAGHTAGHTAGPADSNMRLDVG